MGYSQKYREYIYRHTYPKKSSALFTFHKHPLPGGGYLDDGICELCGKRGSYTLIEDEKPRCCYQCYLKLRRSKEAVFDITGLQKAKYISLAEAKKIIKVAQNNKLAGMNGTQAMGLLALGLLLGRKKR